MTRTKFYFPAWSVVVLLFGIGLWPVVVSSAPMHGIALYGQPKYGPDFTHFDYVNPNAPKGGEARFSAIGSFDTFNQVMSAWSWVNP